MNYASDVLVCWFSELNCYLTKYGCDTVDELDNLLWYESGVYLVIL